MNCKKCNNFLYEYLDGALSDRQRTAMDTHLERCESCRIKLEAEKARAKEIRRMLNETTAGISVNPFMSGRIRSTLNADNKAFTVKGYIMKIRRKYVIGAAAILSTICLGIMIWDIYKPEVRYLKRTDSANSENSYYAQTIIRTDVKKELNIPHGVYSEKSKNVDLKYPKSSGIFKPETLKFTQPGQSKIENNKRSYKIKQPAVKSEFNRRVTPTPSRVSISRKTKLNYSTYDDRKGGNIDNALKMKPHFNVKNDEAAIAKKTTFNTEDYTRIYENEFLAVDENPLSTFSIDVDTASYANMRRFINSGQMPPPDSVRIEELVNYFEYEYPQPDNEHPFSITLEGAECPWNATNTLLLIGIQGKEIDLKEAAPNNLVFLLDVSGSMNQPNKLPLLKQAFKLLTEQLRPQDRVAIVVYAGSSGLVLDSTAGNNKDKILAAIDRLSAGGSTAGAAGITLAYKVAKENFIDEGNNRVILATDGDFNVGVSSDSELVRMIEEKRNDGIFLTVLGLGTGNYKDNKMEQLADKGNGNYSYLDGILEAKKVLVNELGGTLITIAKDVKLQLEFNPEKVKAYRLIGYENRILAKEDFNDDTKDAGELGAGHEVTAIYELVPPDAKQETAAVDDLKYQQTSVVPSEELMTVKLRYKKPDGDTSILITESIEPKQVESKGMPRNLGFASSVAEFGMLLRDSKYKGTAGYDDVIIRAKEYKGKDDNGYRAEFIQLVEKAQLMKK